MGHKIATCSYCGTRAVLVLDRTRHELACASCGAPLHEMKAMPTRETAAARPKARPMTLPRQDYGPAPQAPARERKSKRRKGFGRRMLEEIWDTVEDIFD
jgi:transcription initiation factor TFIIIB Brf1 subunit/transcription initiation factor TFIIB